MGCDPPREGKRRLADRERVARIVGDADGRPAELAERDQFVAAEVLMVLDGEHPPLCRRTRPPFRQGGADCCVELAPFPARRVAVAAQDRGQGDADRCRLKQARCPKGVVEGTRHQKPAAHHRDHVEHSKTLAQFDDLGIRQVGQPRLVDLERTRTKLLRERDEALEPRSIRVVPRRSATLQAEVIG